MKLYIDIESRSVVDLRRTGVYPYAQHKDTEILCIACVTDSNQELLWVPNQFRQRWDETELITTEDLSVLFERAEEIHAHNVQFERVMLQNLGKRYGLPSIRNEVWRCSMAKCGAASLPLGLGKAALALGLEQQKDDEGHRLMLKLSKPRRAIDRENW